MKKIKIFKIHKDSSIPKYMTKGSSGLDIKAYLKKKITIKPLETKLISSGIKIHIKNKNITGIIVPRSGLGHNHGIILGNSIGVIDSDYQGEIMISLFNRSKLSFNINHKDRIAQIIFIPIKKINFNIVNNFKNKTKRNEFGFGHTGIK